MSSCSIIKPYDDKTCCFCGKQIYKETRIHSDTHKSYAYWCPTAGCPNNNGDRFYRSEEEAASAYRYGEDY